MSRPGVENDGPAGGDPESQRPRRNRRGRRRGRRRGKGGGTTQSTGTQSTGTEGGRQDPGAQGGRKHAPAQKNPLPDAPAPQATANGQPGGKNPAGKNTAAAPTGPKPSDLAGPRSAGPKAAGPKAAGAKRQNRAGTPAAMPPKRRRQSAANGTSGSNGTGRPKSVKSADAQSGQRLRTVRETSAGGLVLSDIDDPFDQLKAVLIGRIDRRGRMMWSLPKGHIETGETAEATAIREIAEETGVNGAVVAPLGKIDYWFVSEGRRIHKTVHHFLLRYTGGELSDADYEVSAVAWVPLTELPRRLTYSDERRLARAAEAVIADLCSDPDRLAQSEADANRTEPNEYEKAAAARNQRRNEPPPKPRRRRRRPRRSGAGSRADGAS